MNLFSPTTRCWIFESSLRRARWNFLSHPSIRPILNRFARKGVYNTMFSEPVLGTRGHETLNLDARLATKPTSPYATNFYASCIYQAHLSPLLQLIARTIINRFEIYNRFFLDQRQRGKYLGSFEKMRSIWTKKGGFITRDKNKSTACN